MSSGYQVVCLKEGYSFTNDAGEMKADGSITLLKGKHNIMVDTGGPWDKQLILKELEKNGLVPENIGYVVCSHGHSDHVGNLNLFGSAMVIVSHDICKGDTYFSHDFEKGLPYIIDDSVEVFSTPGHTSNDVSVLVKNVQGFGTVVVAGDLFECEADLQDDSKWKEVSGNPEVQVIHRQKVLQLADYIVPGHGKMFKVPEDIKQKST